jgi:DNA polymerase-1
VQFHLLLADHEARRVHSSYRRAYPGAVRYWAKQIEHVTQYGYVDTIAGRRINLLKGDEWESKHKWPIESTAINGPIQGSGADQKYLAMAVLRDYLPTVDGRFYYELHDGLFVVIPDQYAERAVHEIKHLLSNLPYKSAWGVDLPVQFPVDAKVGKSWGDLKEVL